MTYSRTIPPADRLGIVAAVGTLHLAAFYSVVSGLAVNFVPFVDPPPITATNTPLPKTPPPKPAVHPAHQPRTEPRTGPTHPVLTIIPLGPILPTGPTAGETRPLDPLPPPYHPPPPLFAPKGARPLGQPGSWVGESDYPTGELRLRHAGAVGFTLAIAASGQVTSCAVTRSSGFPVLDETTCRLLARRARFQPAHDDQGRPVAGQFASTVRWQIPD